MINDFGFCKLLTIWLLQIRMNKLHILRHLIRFVRHEVLDRCDVPDCLPHIIPEILFTMHPLDLIFHKARE